MNESPLRLNGDAFWPTLAGWLIALMLALSIANTVQPQIPITLAAGAAWLAGICLWPRVSSAQRVQVGAMSVLGILGLIWGAHHGVSPDPGRVLSQNQLIISMIVSVSLLRLLSNGLDAAEENLPRGKSAYLRSMRGVHLFGAVINISALVIMADRLSRNHPLREPEALLMCRAFSMAVFYSPFIGGMALALAYTPGSDLSTVMLVGVPLTLCGLLTLYGLGRWTDYGAGHDLRGYPVHFESLGLPALLAVGVLALHTMLSGYSVLSLIIILCPVFVAVTLVVRSGASAAGNTLAEFVRGRFPDMVGELVLFLAAGVLATGLSAFISTLGGWVPFEVFDAGAASIVLVCTVVVALAGVHPVVVVSTVVPLFASVDPDPNLMAMLFVMGWGIGCSISPLSGTNVILSGRYGVSNWRIARRNIGFCGLMTLFGIIGLHTYEQFGIQVG